MTALTEEIAAFDRLKADLEAKHLGEWVVIQNGTLIGLYAAFEAAASDAVERFGRGPYLIRQIGALPVNLPASVMYRPANAPDSSRL